MSSLYSVLAETNIGGINLFISVLTLQLRYIASSKSNAWEGEGEGEGRGEGRGRKTGRGG